MVSTDTIKSFFTHLVAERSGTNQNVIPLGIQMLSDLENHKRSSNL